METLQLIGADPQRVEQTLLMILDDFARLDQRSYDELYLWSIVHLGRQNPRHVDTFSPMALALDFRYRSAPWQRERGVPVVDQPYRLCELVCYYYVLYTVKREPRTGDRPYPSLTSCLLRIWKELSGDQQALLGDTLRGLLRSERRPAFGDAYGYLFKPR